MDLLLYKCINQLGKDGFGGFLHQITAAAPVSSGIDCWARSAAPHFSDYKRSKRTKKFIKNFLKNRIYRNDK